MYGLWYEVYGMKPQNQLYQTAAGMEYVVVSCRTDELYDDDDNQVICKQLKHFVLVLMSNSTDRTFNSNSGY